MKTFDTICQQAAKGLAIIVGLLSSTPALAVVFPSELLTEQGMFTNVRGAPVAISGDYLVAGVNPSQDDPPSVSVFHRESRAWQFQGTLSVPFSPLTAGFGLSSVALEGTNLVVGDNYDTLSPGLAYIFSPTDQPALNAWNTSDDTSGTGFYYRYDYALTTNEQQLAATAGWTLTIRSRMLDSFGTGNSPSCFVDYSATPTNRFLIWFSLDNNLNLNVKLEGVAQPLTLTTNGDGWAAYHTHQIVFDPTNGTADYYFDGVKMNISSWSPTPITGLDGIRFGNGSSGGYGSMNWNLVELMTRGTNVLASYEAGTAGTPATPLDPTNQSWSLIADNHTGLGITNGPVSPDFASAWPLEAVLAPPATDYNIGQFGQNVAINGDTILVGAPGLSGFGAPDCAPGYVYVFVHTNSNWVEQAQLSHYVGCTPHFGENVAVDGNTAVVGAQYSSYNGGTSGSVDVFVRNGTDWILQQTLTPANPEGGSQFGANVAVDGGRVAVGAIFENHANNYAGSVYIFDRTNGTWSQSARIFPNDYPSGEQFGGALALKGGVVVASGFYYDRACVFQLGATGWVQATNFIYTDSSDVSIRSVAFDGQDVVVSEAEQGVGLHGAVRIYSPDYGNPVAVANYVEKFLYYPNAVGSPLFDPNQAAFRYKTLLYAQGANGVFAEYTNMANLYGQTERDRADYAESELEKGLAFNPNDPGLGNLLLDIYYDRSEAETIFGDNLLAQAEAARFPSVISGQPTPPSGFVIDNEIPLYEQALAANRFALEGYFSLFTNHLGLADSPPLGYQVFTNLVPTRSLMPATYLDTNGVAHSVNSNNAALFNGYKDLALLFHGLQNYGHTAVALGKLLLAREGSGDRLEASNVVSSAQRLLFLNGALLKGLFATLPGTNDPSGLAQSIDGWSTSLTALNTVEQNLTGGAKLLGFAPDFLMYVYSLPGQPAGIFNSYDTLYTYLNPGNPNNSSHPLSLAASVLQAAESSYAAYRGYQDQYADQMTFLNQHYADRLRDIVGVYPGYPSYGNNPTNNPGSELDQQYQIIQQAQLKILENRTEMSNLVQRVQIELNRASSVSSAMINYGNKAASIEETIGHIQAAQATANAAADEVNTLAQAPELLATGGALAFVVAVNAVNAGVQAGAEERKGELEAEKEQDAALEQAQITGIDSAAAVKTMMLDMHTLLIESEEAALQLHQAVDQLTGLYREKEQLENKLAQQNASLASRYYADPVHRLLARSDMVSANQEFDNAQRWLFFMERALAYKWNTPLDHAYHGITWAEDTLFRLRNADELNTMFNAMNDWDASLEATLAATQTNVDYFSVRDNFFGYSLTNNTGQALSYADPITGQTVDGIQAFRDRLRQLLNTDDPNNSYADLSFSTVRQIPGKSFFQGPVFTSSGTLVSRGLCLDKIQWIKINLPGPHTFGGSSLQGTLTYGGTSFIRNLVVGAYDPLRPDRLMNEMTAYSTRRWYFSPAQDVFTSEEAQTTSASMQLSTQAGIVPSSTEVDVFNERSVATSAWELKIPTTVAGTPVLSIDQLDDIEIWFKHIATDRITQ